MQLSSVFVYFCCSLFLSSFANWIGFFKRARSFALHTNWRRCGGTKKKERNLRDKIRYFSLFKCYSCYSSHEIFSTIRFPKKAIYNNSINYNLVVGTKWLSTWSEFLRVKNTNQIFTPIASPIMVARHGITITICVTEIGHCIRWFAGEMETRNVPRSSRLWQVQHERVILDSFYCGFKFKLFECINLDKKCETIWTWSGHCWREMFIVDVNVLFQR